MFPPLLERNLDGNTTPSLQGRSWLRPEVTTVANHRGDLCGTLYSCLAKKHWVQCHQPGTLEEAITLIEVYAAAKAGQYLLPQERKKKAACTGRGERVLRDQVQEDEPRPKLKMQS